MKQLSFPTKLYLYATYLVGAMIFIWNMNRLNVSNLWMLISLCLLASLALILKVEGSTNRSHYTFSLLIYGFTFTLYGMQEAILVIAVSNLAEWIWNRPPWFIQLFNTTCYIVVMQAAGLAYDWINPQTSLVSWQAILAIVLSMAVFDFLNHLMVGIVVWLARGENFRKSGVFEFFPLVLDLTLLYFGASLSLVWMYNPFALILSLIPIYLIYSTLRVPALERKTELDHKTGLFNHEYLKQQIGNELSRANRFDRPLTIIMADMDLLRNINNTYGHLAGDEVLIGVSRILKQSVRDYDVAARFGGEEFAIMMPETTIEQAYERAESIRKVIEKTEFTIPANVSPIRVTMSFGIAGREHFSQTIDEIIHNADTALYHSKLGGRNQVYAYSNDQYIGRKVKESLPQSVPETPQNTSVLVDKSASKVEQDNSSEQPVGTQATEGKNQADVTESETQMTANGTKLNVNLYIGALVLASLVSFAVVWQRADPMQQLLTLFDWISLLIISVLIAASEWFSVSLYFRQTSVSTSAIAVLAGYLLFGPVGTAVVSAVVSIVLFIKYRSPLSRLFFNFSNHLLAGCLSISLMLITGKPFLEWQPLNQVLLSLASAGIMYLITTWSIALGMSIDLKRPARQIWREQYAWLALYYIAFGLITYTLVFGYKHEHNAGLLLMIIPMVLLRLSQQQYISHTRDAVVELREKNQGLKRNSDEIVQLNEGLLGALSELIDLHDPSVSGHSQRVSYYATEIAKRMKLADQQIELVRKGALIHDIGKIGIPQHILAKPSRLTAEEYEIVKRHCVLGTEFIGRSPSLRPLVPMIHQHHEFYNGKGYPDQLSEDQICIEARILAIADAIESMSSDHLYRKALGPLNVINEIKKQAGTQFDPLIVAVAVKMLEQQTGPAEIYPEAPPDLLCSLNTSAPPP